MTTHIIMTQIIDKFYQMLLISDTDKEKEKGIGMNPKAIERPAYLQVEPSYTVVIETADRSIVKKKFKLSEYQECVRFCKKFGEKAPKKKEFRNPLRY